MQGNHIQGPQAGISLAYLIKREKISVLRMQWESQEWHQVTQYWDCDKMLESLCECVVDGIIVLKSLLHVQISQINTLERYRHDLHHYPHHSAGDWGQGFVQAKQALYQWATSPDPYIIFYRLREISMTGEINFPAPWIWNWPKDLFLSMTCCRHDTNKSLKCVCTVSFCSWAFSTTMERIYLWCLAGPQRMSRAYKPEPK